MPDAPPAASQTPAATAAKSMDDIVALCKRRGFVYPSSEIYGGINGFWDYGPLGVELKRNLKDAWWHDVIRCPPLGPDGQPIDIVGLDSTIIMNPRVWEASGHVGGFNDPMVDDKETKQRFRADKCWVVGFSSFERAVADRVRRDRLMRSLTGESAESFEHVLSEALSESWTANQSEAYYAVEADSAEEAIISAIRLMPKPQLKKLQLDKLLVTLREQHEDKLTYAIHQLSRSMIVPFLLTDLPAGWPRLSPSTQTESLTEARQFNLMFDSNTGAIKDDSSKVYLRPETAQGIFANFWNVVDTSRVKVPFGIAQVGKAFRNEVTPRNFTFRSREFEQMEIEFFIPDPEVVGEDEARTREWYAYWRDTRYQWWQSVGLAGENLTLREHDRDELAHYAKEGAGTSDVEYRFPFTAPGFGELEGVAHRTNFDLRQHAQHTGKGDKLTYFDQERGKRYFPHVIEPSAGADRGTLALICEAYTPDDTRPSGVYMKFHPRMAPIKAGIFPLVNKGGMPEIAHKLFMDLRQRYNVQYDAKQNIGKRYARMDEAGTPYCFTVDGDTLEDNTVTVRHRDTQQQERIPLDRVETFLAERIGV